MFNQSFCVRYANERKRKTFYKFMHISQNFILTSIFTTALHNDLVLIYVSIGHMT